MLDNAEITWSYIENREESFIYFPQDKTRRRRRRRRSQKMLVAPLPEPQRTVGYIHTHGRDTAVGSLLAQVRL
jgi:hypothetical protein